MNSSYKETMHHIHFYLLEATIHCLHLHYFLAASRHVQFWHINIHLYCTSHSVHFHSDNIKTNYVTFTPHKQYPQSYTTYLWHSDNVAFISEQYKHIFYKREMPSKCSNYVTFMFSLLAVLVQLSYINIHTSISSSLIIIQHYMFQPNWPLSGV